MLDFQNLTLLADEVDVYRIAGQERDIFLPKEERERMFRQVFVQVRGYCESLFSHIQAGANFIPAETLLLPSAAVMHHDGRVLLEDFQALVTMSYRRNGVTYLTFANGDVMSSEIHIVTDWSGFGR